MKKILLVCLAVAAAATVNAQARFGIKAGAGYSGYDLSIKDVSLSVNPGYKLGGYGGFVFNAGFGYQWGFQADLLYAYEGAKLRVGKNFLSDIRDSQWGQNSLAGLIGNIPVDFFDKNFTATIDFHQIRLAAMLTFTPNDGLTLMAGPYASYRVGTNLRLNDNAKSVLDAITGSSTVSSDQIIDTYKTLIDKNMKKLDAGVSMGLEYAFCSGVFIDFRYNLGLMNLLEENIDYTALQPNAAKVNLKDLIGITPRAKYHAIQLGLGYRF